ncbi:hypothetical protein ACEXQE_11775 [Herbiconiux sp. P17]|uniref:hypothetical protein n=1 Tax=Herbiconiux wuyangfengii TaxID=3342794 RepID=UPI0035BA4F2E
MTRTHSRSALTTGLALVCVFAAAGLAGCTSSTPSSSIDAATATERYQPVIDDLAAALTDAYPTVTWTDDSETRVTDDGGSGCSLAIGTKRGDPSLPDTAGTWADVMSVANPVLTEHGFAEVSEEESLEGGWTGLSSTDDSGATVSFADKGYTLLSLSVDVTDTDC